MWDRHWKAQSTKHKDPMNAYYIRLNVEMLKSIGKGELSELEIHRVSQELLLTFQSSHA